MPAFLLGIWYPTLPCENEAVVLKQPNLKCSSQKVPIRLWIREKLFGSGQNDLDSSDPSAESLFFFITT